MQARPETQPTETALEAVLGPTFGCYSSLIGLTAAFADMWGYSRPSGWMLKVHDGKKALLYVIPLNDSFRVSMANAMPCWRRKPWPPFAQS